MKKRQSLDFSWLASLELWKGYKYNPRNGYDKATVLMTSERARLKFLLNGFHVILFLHLNWFNTAFSQYLRPGS